ncbi:hypothetical protein [Novosphingobium lindaniclasticum]|uniref:HTH marR-type domain-containing protein n=1 Tax=Novosphingobium lindaniclasticum LE124 TaxID=1096930 RepID=T0ILM8_9SPHN|nr:hypothetical protein [Novosphingobium lindaniclasticum]EQB12675.1 hypothetical protein L284_14975 [Novosphingobium lindaniclasticum LE124]
MTSRSRRSDQLTLRVGDLTDFSTALIVLAELAPERTTLAQMTFFLLAATADLSGKPATFSSIKEAVGPLINKSLHTTYKVFLDKPLTRSDYESKRQGLGWLYREENPVDNREKFLRLTAQGRNIIAELMEALDGAKPQPSAKEPAS